MHDERDPVGAASARLLGAGIPRPERRMALRVLGLLLDHADCDGVVRLHPAVLAGEFDLERAAVDAAFLQLRGVGMLLPTPVGWRIDDFAGYQRGGINAGAALTLMFDLLDEPAREPSAAPPLAAPPHARVPLGPVPPRRAPLAACVALLLLLLVAVGSRPPEGDVAVQAAATSGVAPASADHHEERELLRVDRRTSSTPPLAGTGETTAPPATSTTPPTSTHGGPDATMPPPAATPPPTTVVPPLPEIDPVPAPCAPEPEHDVGSHPALDPDPDPGSRPAPAPAGPPSPADRLGVELADAVRESTGAPTDACAAP